jgi:hypothetical protein
MGQSSESGLTEIISGGMVGTAIGEVPEILLQGGREAQHSELTWKLISKFASIAENEKASLRSERDIARADSEGWREKYNATREQFVALTTRWESVSTLTTVQSFLFAAGGLLLGPTVQDWLSGRWAPQSVMVGLLGAAAIAGALVLGKLGPKRNN